MKIKRQLIIAVLAITIPLLCISCKKDDDNANDDGGSTTQQPTDGTGNNPQQEETFFGGTWAETSKGTVTYVTCEDDIVFRIAGADVKFKEISKTELEITLTGWNATTVATRDSNYLTFPNSITTSIPETESFKSLTLETTSGTGYIYEKTKAIDIVFEVRGNIVLPYGGEYKVLGKVVGEIKKKE